MQDLTPLEAKIFNEGERLIPGVTHNVDELVRHKNSYEVWKAIIEYDIAHGLVTSNPIKIADFGSGVGHGCLTLSEIPNSEVIGIDNSQDTVDYANQYYHADNIHYEVGDLASYVDQMPDVDYVVSRGVLEHIPNGLEIAKHSQWKCRLMFDVPYREKTGNPHHLLHFIDETAFADFERSELFYQDLKGFLFNSATKPENPLPNMIMCMSRAEGFVPVNEIFTEYPVRLWYPAADDAVWQLDKKYATVRPAVPFHRKVVGKIKRILRDLSGKDS